MYGSHMIGDKWLIGSYVVEGAFLRSYAGRSQDTVFCWSIGGVLWFGDVAVIQGEMTILTHFPS
jgi:hypothetical protein